jgi:hypothetical protein
MGNNCCTWASLSSLLDVYGGLLWESVDLLDNNMLGIHGNTDLIMVAILIVGNESNGRLTTDGGLLSLMKTRKLLSIKTLLEMM